LPFLKARVVSIENSVNGCTLCVLYLPFLGKSRHCGRNHLIKRGQIYYWNSGDLLLSALKDGTGGSTVSSDIGAIFCGAACSDNYPYGDTVLHYATPSPTSLFTGWLDCPGIGACTVSITGAKSVTATFTAAPKVKIGAVTYPNLQAAYDVAQDNAVIRMLDGVDAGPLTTNRFDRVIVR
jgi:hypothetical protein